MNHVILIGRLTKNPDVNYKGDMAISKYTLAVDRKAKDKQADFIRCVAFGKQAEFAERYLSKGSKIGVIGRIQTGSYKTQDGRTVYTTDVIVNEHEFVTSKADKSAESVTEAPREWEEAIQEELPFV